eukprot:12032609-Alexandrium_andersonii.AAC.1
MEPPEAGRPDATQTRESVLLSLFDGVGAAHIAVDMVLTAVGRPRALVAAWYCEKQESLAAAVQREWERRAQAFGATPYRRAAAD